MPSKKRFVFYRGGESYLKPSSASEMYQASYGQLKVKGASALIKKLLENFSGSEFFIGISVFRDKQYYRKARRPFILLARRAKKNKKASEPRRRSLGDILQEAQSAPFTPDPSITPEAAWQRSVQLGQALAQANLAQGAQAAPSVQAREPIFYSGATMPWQSVDWSLNTPTHLPSPQAVGDTVSFTSGAAPTATSPAQEGQPNSIRFVRYNLSPTGGMATPTNEPTTTTRR